MNLMEENSDRKQMDEELLDELQHAVGSCCELRSMDNILSGLGRIHSMDGTSITITSDETDMPQVIYNTEFKIIVRPTGRQTLALCGKVCGSSRDFWKLDSVSRYAFQENRAYFRQRVSTNAYVACINGLYKPEQKTEVVTQAKLFQVSDISLEGVQIRSQEACFKTGDWLLMTDLILVPAEKRAHSFICQVRRLDQISRNEYVFGCQLAFVNEQEQDGLCSDIFTIHRQDIQAHRW